MFECLISRSVARPHFVKCSILNWCLTSSKQMRVQEATTAPTTKRHLKIDFRPWLNVFRLFQVGRVVRSERSVFFTCMATTVFIQKQPKKDLRVWARVVDRTSYLKISRRHLTTSSESVPHVHNDYFSSSNHIDLCRCRNGFLNSPKRCHFFNL